MINSARILRENNTEIMHIWQNQVLLEVPASRESKTIALYDYLPNLINDIADIIMRFDSIVDIKKDKKFIEILNNSEEHGRQRSTEAFYTVEQIVHEYIIFHRTLTAFLDTHKCYFIKVLNVLQYILDSTILKSVSSFSLSLQQMQEKLIGTIAHDIRNPLSAAQLALQMIEVNNEDEWSEKMLVAAKLSVNKALGLIEGLMDGITVKAGEGMMLNFEEIDILQVIKSLYNESKDIYGNDINLECQQEEIFGIFDSTAIRRLIENLITNAVKYGLPNRPVTISIVDKADAIEIKVHNYGKPISIDKQQYIFKFLARETKGKKLNSSSWGMGLTLTQMVAEAHGGAIKLKSDAENGTLFTVSLLKYFNQPGKKRSKRLFVKHNNLN